MKRFVRQVLSTPDPAPTLTQAEVGHAHTTLVIMCLLIRAYV